MFNIRSSLRHIGETAEFVLTDKFGCQTIFNDDTHAERSGLFTKLRNAAGEEFVAVLEEPTYRIASISRTVNGKNSGLYYAYVPDEGAGAGLIQSVTLRLSDVDVRRVVYSYYDGESLGGSARDLQSAIIEQFDSALGVWNEVGRTFYRYYVAGESSGFEHGLKFVVNSETCARLHRSGLRPESATDEQLAGFSDYHFFFDGARRVVREDVAAGTYTHTFEYSEGPWPTGAIWSTRTIETLPDGSTNTVYCNGWTQAVLKVFNSGGNTWCHAYAIDENGNYSMEATPAAVLEYSESTPSLFTLRGDEGLIKHWTYYNELTGGPRNALRASSISKGNTVGVFPMEEHDYTEVVNGASSTWFPYHDYAFLTEEGYSVATTYTYTFFPGTFQMQTRIATLPAVSGAQNGSDISNTRGEIFDIYGRRTWTRDERGFLTAFVTDPVTGALSRRIDDVNTAILPCPAGWETPDIEGAGQHLVSDFQRDIFGREIASYGPWHEIDRDGALIRIRRAAWTVYCDAEFETWSASGYVSGNAPHYIHTVMNPVNITRTDRDARVLDEIVAVRAGCYAKSNECFGKCGDAPVETCDRLDSTRDSFPQASWVRWTSTAYDMAYRTAWRRLYFNIPDAGAGLQGIHYGQTDFAYDSMGRVVRQQTPGRTITRTVFDGRGLDIATWVGTDDSGATPAHPDGEGAEGNNMTLITEREYDSGSVGGNGNLTMVTAWFSHEGGGENRITRFLYDWRDRRIQTNGEENFHEFYTLDFRGLVTVIERRGSETIDGTLLMRSTSDFDVRGRAWRRSVLSVEGGVANNIVSELFWYDATGNLMCRRSSNGNGYEKMAFDGLGRTVTKAKTCRSELPDYEEAGNLDSDTVMEQANLYYDAASNLITQRIRERNHNAAGAGGLKGPDEGQPSARTLYQCSWSDGIGRLLAAANYGTNGAETLARLALIPESTPLCLVSKTRYNARGEACAFMDPNGKVDVQVLDDAGRLIRTVENCHP